MIGVSQGAIHRRISIQGQSNARGKGARSEIAALSDNGLTVFDTGTFARVYIWNPTAGAYQQMKNDTNTDALSGCIGPEFGLAVRWMRETVRGKLYIDKLQYDGHAIADFQSGSGVVYNQAYGDGTSNYWQLSVSHRAAADAWLTNNNIRVSNMGWLWIQGESDNNQTQAYYQGQLATYIANRISAGLQPSNAQNLIVQMYPGTALFAQTIVDAKTAYQAANPATAKLFTMTNHFNADNLHSNAQGQLQMGYDSFELFFSKSHLVG